MAFLICHTYINGRIRCSVSKWPELLTPVCGVSPEASAKSLARFLTERELTEARERANDKVKRTEASNSKLLEKIAMLEAENRQLKLQNMELGQFKTAKSAFLEAVDLLK